MYEIVINSFLFIISIIVSVTSYQKKYLTYTGMISAIVMGTLTLVLGGYQCLLIMKKNTASKRMCMEILVVEMDGKY